MRTPARHASNIRATALGAAYDGIRITAGGSTIRGLAIYGFAAPTASTSAPTNNVIVGNYSASMPQAPRRQRANDIGIHINGNSDFNTIGGTATTERNVISGQNASNGVGIDIEASTGNIVRGNFIGTEPRRYRGDRQHTTESRSPPLIQQHDRRHGGRRGT